MGVGAPKNVEKVKCPRISYNLAMADAIVYAAALANNCNLITSDRDLDALPQVTFIHKA